MTTPGLDLRRLCFKQRVLPVLVIDDAAKAGTLARIFVACGLPVIEITLRTPAAAAAITAASHVQGCTVGAGTLLTAQDATDAVSAGASFGVSPGMSEQLTAACETVRLPFLPGIATPSEAIRAAEIGFDCLKFFPAETSGGCSALNAFAQTMPNLHFCPTGGISAKSVNDYLALPNVACVGGSWIAPRSDVDSGNWTAIEQRARAAAELN